MPDGPMLPRRRLGTELRRLRGKRTLGEVATSTMISTSKLSRLENGQGAPQQRDIRDLINYYELDRASADRIRRWTNEGRKRAWWKDYSDNIPGAPIDTYLDFESGASVIRSYAPLIIPGLLQTSDYATHLVEETPPAKDDEDVQRIVELRMLRQQLLTVPVNPTQLTVVLDEAAVRRRFGSLAETVAQLKHLREFSKLRNISILIIPFEKGLHPGLNGMFTVFQFADDIDRDIVSLETYSGDRHLEEQSSVLEYLRIFDSLTHKALDHDESRSLLTSLMESLTREKDSR